MVFTKLYSFEAKPRFDFPIHLLEEGMTYFISDSKTLLFSFPIVFINVC